MSVAENDDLEHGLMALIFFVTLLGGTLCGAKVADLIVPGLGWGTIYLTPLTAGSRI